MESCGDIPNTVWFHLPEERTCSPYSTSRIWLQKALPRAFVSEFYDWQKRKRKQNPPLSSLLAGPSWDLKNKISFSSNFDLFCLADVDFFFFLTVFLMEPEINMAFCLPPNLCAAIINVVSIVLGIGFVYCFSWASKGRNAEKTALLIPFQFKILFFSQKWS